MKSPSLEMKAIIPVLVRKMGVVFFFLVLSLFVLRGLLAMDGTIGHSLDWSIPPMPYQLARFIPQAMYLWHERNLGFDTIYIVDAPYLLIEGWLGLLGFSGDTVSKLLITMTVTVSGCSMFYLIREMLSQDLGLTNGNLGKNSFGKRNLGALIGGIFYALSPTLFNQLVAGARSYFVAYSISPLVILFFLKSVKGEIYRFQPGYIILSAIFFTMASSQIQFAIMLTAILVAYILFLDGKIARVKALLLIFSLTLIFNSYWILNFLLSLFTPASLSIVTAPASNPLALEHITTAAIPLVFDFILVGFWGGPYYYWFLKAIDPSLIDLWLVATFLLVMTIFSSLVFRPQNRIIPVLLLLSLASFFFAKGGRPPLGPAVLWLFENFTIFYIFRSFQHLLFIPTFSYAVILGMIIGDNDSDDSDVSFSIKLEFGNQKSVHYRIYRRSYPAFFIAIMILIYVHPYFSGYLGGNLQTYRLPRSYLEIDDFLGKAETQDFRIVYLPMANSPIFKSSKYQMGGQGGDMMVTNSIKPSYFSDSSPPGSSTRALLRNLDLSLYENKVEYIGRFFGLLNTKYVILRPDIEHAHPWYSGFYTPAYPRLLSALERQRDLSLVKRFKDGTMLWENKDFIPHIYASNSAVLVDGDAYYLIPLTYTEYIERPSIFFMDELTQEEILGILSKKSTVLLTGCQIWSHVPIEKRPNQLRNPSFEVGGSNNPSMSEGWSYVEISNSKAVAQRVNNTAYNGDYSFKIIRESGLPQLRSDNLKVEGNMYYTLSFSLKVDSPKVNAVQYEIIWFTKEGKTVGPYASKFTKGTIDWKRHHLTTLSPQNAVTAQIRFTVHQSVTAYFDAVQLGRGLYYQDWEFATDQTKFWDIPQECNHVEKTGEKTVPANISYRKVDPTRYQVQVDAEEPFWLIFSESFHPNWKAFIDGKAIEEHYMVNGFANGYYVSKTGKYQITLEYEPQRIYEMGRTISLIALMLSVLYFIVGWRKNLKTRRREINLQ